MIFYHGTPLGGDNAGVARFFKGRHALIPFNDQRDLKIAFDACQTVVFDNGAFGAWKRGKPVEDWSEYYEWCEQWHRHPAFQWAIIPDVIEGTEQDNDELIAECTARELVNRIQNMRKDAGFDVSDRIAIGVQGDDELEAAAEIHREYVAGEVLAEDVVIGSIPDELVVRQTSTVNGHEGTLALRKIS